MHLSFVLLLATTSKVKQTNSYKANQSNVLLAQYNNCKLLLMANLLCSAVCQIASSAANLAVKRWTKHRNTQVKGRKKEWKWPYGSCEQKPQGEIAEGDKFNCVKKILSLSLTETLLLF